MMMMMMMTTTDDTGDIDDADDTDHENHIIITIIITIITSTILITIMAVVIVIEASVLIGNGLKIVQPRSRDAQRSTPFDTEAVLVSPPRCEAKLPPARIPSATMACHNRCANHYDSDNQGFQE